MAQDPVCGMDVDEKGAARSSVYQGKTYCFCSTGCKAAFDVNPDRYVGPSAQKSHGAGGHGSGHPGG